MGGSASLRTAGGRRLLLLVVGCLVLLLAGCATAREPDGPAISQTLLPAPAELPLELPTELAGTPLADATLPDTGWVELGPGINGRRLLLEPHRVGIAPDEAGERMVPVHMLRLDPAVVTFAVGYAPDAPRAFAAWCAEPGTLAAINGGFFHRDYQSTALVIAQGVASGTSYEGQGGMFAVDSTGAVSLRHLADQPYRPDEPLVEALQGWPMLIRPGGQVIYPTAESGDRARRSVLAIDQAGNVVLLAFPTSDFTLRGLADWLVSSDLGLDAAMNLDGGSSTGLCANAPLYQARIDAFGPLPLVLLVRAR